MPWPQIVIVKLRAVVDKGILFNQEIASKNRIKKSRQKIASKNRIKKLHQKIASKNRIMHCRRDSVQYRDCSVSVH
jgi:hypothetical protein